MTEREYDTVAQALSGLPRYSRTEHDPDRISGIYLLYEDAVYVVVLTPFCADSWIRNARSKRGEYGWGGCVDREEMTRGKPDAPSRYPWARWANPAYRIRYRRNTPSTFSTALSLAVRQYTQLLNSDTYRLGSGENRDEFAFNARIALVTTTEFVVDIDRCNARGLPRSKSPPRLTLGFDSCRSPATA
ncbi:hypothetical protein [Haladaptatus salinisoli]|uniref:hypothetical protein n=1 Tax=Haladaptatus salinisoli TaxID=2884876 RepID=UPI001D09FFC1|nr:hypothetical protein [Haladaptatus salinisoli]